MYRESVSTHWVKKKYPLLEGENIEDYQRRIKWYRLQQILDEVGVTMSGSSRVDLLRILTGHEL